MRSGARGPLARAVLARVAGSRCIAASSGYMDLDVARARRRARDHRLLGLWSCVGKGEIRHDEGLAIDMKFTPAAAFLIGFSQRSFVWAMAGGS